ncbi:hypothetical protein JCM24511_05771 [Saitozyma sp. JCM 24511]|nr:hypothetical protein JCM24511_05771 [Saitozyma sp. JCM 24511]
MAQPWTSSRVAKRRKAGKGKTEESIVFPGQENGLPYNLTVLEDVGEGKAMPEVEKELKDAGVF